MNRVPASDVNGKNVQRAEWRKKCRQILADYLSKSSRSEVGGQLTFGTECTLGISIEPAQVRLLPDPQDGYVWRFLPEKKHLFTKQLSKLSVGVYMELSREVGKSFEAVASSAADSKSIVEDPNVRSLFHLGCISNNYGGSRSYEFQHELFLEDSPSPGRECETNERTFSNEAYSSRGVFRPTTA